jgi:hypothetical protein
MHLCTDMQWLNSGRTVYMQFLRKGPQRPDTPTSIKSCELRTSSPLTH